MLGFLRRRSRYWPAAILAGPLLLASEYSAFSKSMGKSVGIDTRSAENRSTRTLRSTCAHRDPSVYCVGLKYVVFADESGRPISNEAEAATNLATINYLWKPCRIAFQIEAFQTVNPKAEDIRFSIGRFSELDQIRRTYGDDQTLLIAVTGPWSRKEGLGKTSANAWTSLPGEGPYGAVLEKKVAKFANIIAHELGHYLGLLHIQTENSLMNPIIYSYSKSIPQAQCESARNTLDRYWSSTLR